MSSVLLSKLNPDQVFSPDTDREIDRLDREQELIKQRDRQDIQPDRSPDESIDEFDDDSILGDAVIDKDEWNESDTMLDGLLEALKRRL